MLSDQLWRNFAKFHLIWSIVIQMEAKFGICSINIQRLIGIYWDLNPGLKQPQFSSPMPCPLDLRDTQLIDRCKACFIYFQTVSFISLVAICITSYIITQNIIQDRVFKISKLVEINTMQRYKQHELTINYTDYNFVYSTQDDWHGSYSPYYIFAYSAFFIDKSVYGNDSIVIIGLAEKKSITTMICAFDISPDVAIVGTYLAHLLLPHMLLECSYF